MARPCRELAEAHGAQLATERLFGDRNSKLFKDPLRQIDEAPAHDAMDSRDGAILHDPPQRLALAVVENASSARRLAVQKTIETFRVETDNPVALSNGRLTPSHTWPAIAAPYCQALPL
jgi:hypothetical protein